MGYQVSSYSPLPLMPVLLSHSLIIKLSTKCHHIHLSHLSHSCLFCSLILSLSNYLPSVIIFTSLTSPTHACSALSFSHHQIIYQVSSYSPLSPLPLMPVLLSHSLIIKSSTK